MTLLLRIIFVLLSFAVFKDNSIGDFIKWPLLAIGSGVCFFISLFQFEHFSTSKPAKCLLALIGIITLSAIFHWQRAFSIETLIPLFAGFIIFNGATHLTKNDFPKIAKTISLCAFVMAGFGLLENLFKPFADLFIEWAAIAGKTHSFLGHENDVAMYLCATIPFTAFTLWHNRKRVFSILFHSLSLILQIGCVAIDDSRAGQILLGMVCPACFVLFSVISRTKIILLCALAVLVFSLPNTTNILKIPYSVLFQTKAEYADSGCDQLRKDMWKSSMAMIMDQPMGLGPGGFERDYPRYKSHIRATDPTQHYQAPLCETLHYTVDFGIAGGCLFVAFCFLTVWIGFKASAINPLSGFSAIAFLSLFLQGNIDVCLRHPPMLFLFFLAAGIISAGAPKTAFPARYTAFQILLCALTFLFCFAAPVMAVRFWDEDRLIARNEIEHIKNPSSLLGKYAVMAKKMELGKNPAKEMNFINRYAPHYRYVDYYTSAYAYNKGDIQAAKKLFANFKRIHQPFGQTKDYETFLKGNDR